MTKFGLVFLIVLIGSTVMAGMPPRRSQTPAASDQALL